MCKAYKDYFGVFRIFNSADLSDTVLFYGCYMELECADKLCVYLRRCGYSISSVCDTGGGRLLYGGVYGINDCVCIDVIFWWVFESPVGGYIVMLLYAAEEMYRGLVFNGRVTMNAVVISEKHIRVFSNFIYPVLVLAGLLMITYILFCKKDLLKKDIYN